MHIPIHVCGDALIGKYVHAYTYRLDICMYARLPMHAHILFADQWVRPGDRHVCQRCGQASRIELAAREGLAREAIGQASRSEHVLDIAPSQLLSIVWGKLWHCTDFPSLTVLRLSS